MKHITLVFTSFMLVLFVFFSSAKCQQSLQWTPSNFIKTGNILKISEVGEGVLYALTDSGIITSIDGGKTFLFTLRQPILMTGEKIVDITLVPDGTILAGVGTNHSAALVASTDKGTSWTRISIPGNYVGPIGIQALPNGTLLIALGMDHGLFRTANFGKTWDTIKSPAFQEGSMGGFSVTSSGGLFNYGTNYAALSNDTGKTWIPTSSVAFGNPGGPIVGVVSNNLTDIFLCDAGGVFYSSNTGVDWASRNSGITNLNTSGIAIDTKGRLFVSTYTDGVFLSFNKGDTWYQNNQGLENTHVQSMLLSKINQLYAGTTDKIYRTSALLAVGDNSIAQGKTTISPNPVSSSAAITYFSENAGLVKLGIFNILGKEIEMLVGSIQEAGAHTVTFNAANLPSGTYYCRIESNGKMEMKTVVVAH